MRYLVLLLLLGACAGPAVVYKPSPTPVVITSRCKIAEVTRPNWPTAGLRRGFDYLEGSKAMTSELALRRGYEAKLEAAVKSCQ